MFLKENDKRFFTVEGNILVGLDNRDVRSQLPLDSSFNTNRSTATQDDACQNGMFLVYDEVAGKVRRPANENEHVYLHYSSPLNYDVRTAGHADFAVGIENGFYPVLVAIYNGDKITTDAIDATDFDAVAEGDYFVPTNGVLTHVGATKPVSGFMCAQLVKGGKTTMPHGGPGFKVKLILL